MIDEQDYRLAKVVELPPEEGGLPLIGVKLGEHFIGGNYVHVPQGEALARNLCETLNKALLPIIKSIKEKANVVTFYTNVDENLYKFDGLSPSQLREAINFIKAYKPNWPDKEKP